MVQIHLPLLFQDVGKLGNPRGPEPRDRRFKSDRPDSAFPQTLRCGQTVRQPPVKRMSAGSIPATGAFEYGRASQLVMAAASRPTLRVGARAEH